MRDRHWRMVEQIVTEADIVLYVLDARFGTQAISNEAIKIIENNEKKVIYIINKADLISKQAAKDLQKKLYPSVLVSVSDRVGVNRMRGAIAQHKPKKPQCSIAVIGYPNAGKSSVINILKGRSSAKASSRAGTTVGIQNIRINKDTMLIDSPGIIPLNEQSAALTTLLDSKNIDHIKDPEGMWYSLLDVIVDLYGPKLVARSIDVPLELLTPIHDGEAILQYIAIKKHRLLKGGIPDTATIAKKLMSEWQKGTLINKKNTQESYNREDYE